MVSLEKFYENMKVRYHNEQVQEKFKPLMDDVIRRLPDKPPFEQIDEIFFAPRSNVIKNLNSLHPELKISLDVTPENRDGHCQTGISEAGDISECVVSLITDSLQVRSDDYIKGIIIHEICHMVHLWKLLQKEKPSFLKLGFKAKKIRLDQIDQTHIKAESPEYYEKEKQVNTEAIRLGFEKEISAIE